MSKHRRTFFENGYKIEKDLKDLEAFIQNTKAHIFRGNNFFETINPFNVYKKSPDFIAIDIKKINIKVTHLLALQPSDAQCERIKQLLSEYRDMLEASNAINSIEKHSLKDTLVNFPQPLRKLAL